MAKECFPNPEKGYVDCIEDGKTKRHYYYDPDAAAKAAKEGPGDWAERQLKKIGVTPEWYVAAKTFLGFTPICSCAERKAWLNKAGKWWANEV